MTCSISHVTFDAHDAYAQAVWWSELLGGHLAADDFPGDPEAVVEGIPTPVLFITVPEGKTVKNRAHLDIRPSERTRDEEVEWVRSLGATQVDDQRKPDGTGWVVFADPEGNEFCMLRSLAEVAAGS